MVRCMRRAGCGHAPSESSALAADMSNSMTLLRSKRALTGKRLVSGCSFTEFSVPAPQTGR
eukprot:2962908-Prymnesium_polylepis.2